jgi:integrase
MRPRKDGRFCKTARDQSGRRIFGYGRTPEEAEEDLRRKLDDARWARSAIPADAGTTLHDFANDVWHPTLAHLAPGSRRRYEDAYRLHIRDELGPLPLREIDFQTLQAWMNRLSVKRLPNGRTIAANSVNAVRMVLVQILRLAYDLGAIDRLPTTRLRSPKRPPERERVLHPEDAARLLEAVDGTDLSAVVFLACVLGLRRGELCGLKWSDLDRVRGELTICRQRRRRYGGGGGAEEASTKTRRSARRLYLTPGLVAEIDRRGNLDSEFVCTNRRGEPWRPDSLSRRWLWFARGFGLDGWTLHDLRHCAAGLLFAAGCDVLAIAAVLGHTSVDTTRLYVAVEERRRLEAVERLAKSLGF